MKVLLTVFFLPNSTNITRKVLTDLCRIVLYDLDVSPLLFKTGFKHDCIFPSNLLLKISNTWKS